MPDLDPCPWCAERVAVREYEGAPAHTRWAFVHFCPRLGTGVTAYAPSLDALALKWNWKDRPNAA